MTGYLDKEQLKEMKREDLQKLAKDLGVSAGGKTEEIIDRITAIEVEVPEEGEEDDMEGAAGQQEGPPKGQEEPKKVETDKLTAGTEKANDRADKAAGMVTVKVVERYLDRNLNKIKEVGETFSVSQERADMLLAKNVAEIIR